MGRTRDQKNVQSQLDNERNRLNSSYDRLNTDLSRGLGDSQNRASNLLNETLSNYRNFLGRNTSGMGIGSAARSGFNRYANGGGVTSENASRIRGNGTFDEFARTGGLSESDKGTYRARGTASIPAFYDNLRNELSTSRAAQGNYSPGYDAQMAKSVRDQSSAYQDAATNVEGDILDRVTQGRMWGAEGMSGAEQALVAAIQRGEMFGIGGLADSDKFDSSLALQNSGLDLNAIQGMQSLYGMEPGEVSMYLRALLQGSGQRDSAVGSNLATNAGFNSGSNWWDRWGKSVFGGLASIGGGYASAPRSTNRSTSVGTSDASRNPRARALEEYGY